VKGRCKATRLLHLSQVKSPVAPPASVEILNG
jgi:hypothetical protein